MIKPHARLFAPDYRELGLEDRSSSLLLARDLGLTAAEGATSAEELEEADLHNWYIHVVSFLLHEDAITLGQARSWRRRCRDGSALNDPRVQAFLFGWHERATTLLQEFRRAKWEGTGNGNGARG